MPDPVVMLSFMDVQLYPLLIGVGFFVWLVLFRWRRDVVAAGVLGFSLPFAVGWAYWWTFVAIGLAHGKPLSGVGLPIVWSGLAGALFVLTALVAAYALAVGPSSRCRR